MTDLDRLHEASLGHRAGRGRGNTFRACHEIAQEILMEQPVIFYVAAQIRHIRSMMPMFLDILKEHSIEVTQRQHEKIWAGKSIVIFTSIEFINWQILHYKKYSIVYDND